MARESALEQRATRWARARRWVVAKMTYCEGIPDKVFFIPGGSPLVVEFKRLNGEFRPLQPAYISKLRRDGYTVVWIETWDDWLQAVKGIKTGCQWRRVK